MKNSRSQKGFSLIELLVVIVIMAILITVSVMSFASTRKYNADDQALEIVDLLSQARQSALNQRRVFRVEINKTKRQVTLINENDFSKADDDKIVKFITLRKGVFVNQVPGNVAAAPTASTPIPILDFVSSNYPLSSGEEKITLRFARNGRVLDTGSDNIGTGSLMRGATIYVYTNKEETNTPEIIRAVTVTQTSGSTSILKCSFDSTKKCGNWKR
jgi:prepilin-type N-terminal cleavage/methylation domain-containing protein